MFCSRISFKGIQSYHRGVETEGKQKGRRRFRGEIKREKGRKEKHDKRGRAFACMRPLIHRPL